MRQILRLLSCMRFDEILVLQGAPLLGALFSMGPLTPAKALDLSIFASGSFCLVAHVFVLNDWSGMNTDLQDPNRNTGVFTNKGVGHSEIRYLWIALLAFSLLVFSFFGWPTLILALGIAALSALYSAPALHMKGVPFANSALHVLGGVLHFLLGYSIFGLIDGRGLAIGCFFGLVFAAGHLTHESRDRESDLLNGIRTNAVAFGQTRSLSVSFALFTIADMLLFTLAIVGFVPRILVLVAALYPLQLYWWLRTIRSGLTFSGIRGLQVRYRTVYAIIGVMMLVAALLGH